jgi:hypothetical protein
MKKIATLLCALMLSGPAFAVIKCENTPKGMCCWDVNRDGPFKPISCY